MGQPRYFAIGLVSAAVALGILAWIPNAGLLWTQIATPAGSLSSKLAFTLAGYTSLITNYSLFGSFVIVVFAMLTGLNLALVIFITKSSYRDAALSGTRNTGALVLAALGAGCAACGTSFLAPLLGGIAGTATIAFTDVLGVAVNILGLALLLYSVFRLGISAQRFTS
jgi:hypothetical protein